MHNKICYFRLLLILVVVVEFWALVCVLCFDDRVSVIQLLGDSEIDDVDVVDGCIAVVIDFVLQCY